MLEIVQSKAEELLRREEEGRTMRLLYQSEVRSKEAFGGDKKNRWICFYSIYYLVFRATIFISFEIYWYELPLSQAAYILGVIYHQIANIKY